MQNIISLALILWELLKKEEEGCDQSLIKFWQLFNYFAAPKQKIQKSGVQIFWL